MFCFVILLTTFLLLSFFFRSIDLQVMILLNGPPASLDPFYKWVSKSSAWISIATALGLLVVGLLNKNRKYQFSGVAAGGAIALAALITYIVKHVFQRVRPNISYPEVIFEKEHLSGWSFPSGHASGAFAIVFYVCLLFPRWYVVMPLFVYATMVAYSRVYLGVHYPSDVIAGSLLGFGITYLMVFLENYLSKSDFGTSRNNPSRCVKVRKKTSLSSAVESRDTFNHIG